jgi:hypothetical protein
VAIVVPVFRRVFAAIAVLASVHEISKYLVVVFIGG